MKRLALLASVLAELRSPPASFRAAAEGPRAAQLNTMYGEFWEEYLKLNPVTATFAGDPRCNASSRISFAAEFEAQSKAFEQKYLDRAQRHRHRWPHEARTASPTTSSRWNRESALEELRFPTACCPSTSSTNIANYFAQFGSGTSAQPFAHREELRRLAEARCEDAGDPGPGHRQHARWREGRHRAAGVLMEKVLPQLDANIVDDVREEHFWGRITQHAEGVFGGGS